jgi:hypothetical protein
MDKIDEFLEENFKKCLFEIDKYTNFQSNKERIDFLYHYTDLNGFLGIFNTNSLWASNAFFLNDSSEINYGLNLSYPLFNEFYLSIKSEKAKEILKKFHENYVGFVLNSNLFLISFCESGDLLSQWRGYAPNNDGVSVRFNLPVMRTLSEVNLYKVIYDTDNQIKIITYLFDLLKDLIEYFERTKTISFLHYFNSWITIFTTLILTLKDSSFSEEKEWRLIYNYDAIGNNKKIEYRTKNGYILPYIKIEKLKLLDLVSGIIIGPSSNSKILEKSIAYFLEMNNHNIAINQSKVPYRK